jgi:hypothetical protein
MASLCGKSDSSTSCASSLLECLSPVRLARHSIILMPANLKTRDTNRTEWHCQKTIEKMALASKKREAHRTRQNFLSRKVSCACLIKADTTLCCLSQDAVQQEERDAKHREDASRTVQA